MIGIKRHTLNKLKQFKPSINVLVQSRFVETSNTKDGTSNAEVMERKKAEVSEAAKKKPQKPPFAKNLFLGKFDRDILTYPEVLNRDRHEMLHEMIDPIEKFFREEVDSKRIDAEARIPPETLQGLKDLGLYG
ncbi:UNVERIFIED_CONTAM: hypothetical protein GTU68_037315, partial [Idotea baltica]|nr:hypothetical protein [Idotea baltica]